MRKLVLIALIALLVPSCYAVRLRNADIPRCDDPRIATGEWTMCRNQDGSFSPVIFERVER